MEKGMYPTSRNLPEQEPHVENGLLDPTGHLVSWIVLCETVFFGFSVDIGTWFWKKRGWVSIDE
jgi:hypothetical protein